VTISLLSKLRKISMTLLASQIMTILLQIDWKSVFVPSLSIVEVIVRGTIVYLFLFAVLRILRRDAGSISISDLLVVVIIADAAQNAMGSDYKSITEGVVLVMTIAFWDYFLDWLGYQYPSIGRLLHPPPLPLIKDGKLQWRNMRKELITESELMTQLREQGIEDVSEVKKSYLEADGHISVIKKEDNEKGQGKKKSIPQ
jgi:uncharacterized membrane protein YcaP (DUF421 family)